MLTVVGNKITINQGETASVDFMFKNLLTNAPVILGKLPEDKNYQHRFRFDLSKGSVNNTAEKIATIDWLITDQQDGQWHIFEEDVIRDWPENISKPSVIPSEGTLIPELEPNILYKLTVRDAVAYLYADEEGLCRYYDYEDSVLTLMLKREYTVNLQPKTYHYEISHVVVDADNNDEIVIKTTFVPPSEFIVKGALV